MARTETVEFTNMCMICDGSRVVVIDRKKRDWPGITFPGGHIEPGESFTDAVIRVRCRRKLDCISVLPSSAVSKTGVKISAGCCAAL